MEIHRHVAAVEQVLSSCSVRLGVPMLDQELAKTAGFFMIDVPANPHVFYVKQLRLEEDGEEVSRLEGVVVMIGHAYVLGDTLDDWKFATGKSVSETIKGYEQAQEMFDLPPVDVVLACRDDISNEARVQHNFNYHKFPYIAPAHKKVTIHHYGENEVRSWVKPGEGVGLLVADTGQWNGVDRWQDYWKVRNDRSKYKIPNWALNPAFR